MTHGVQRIFHFVRNARSDAAKRGETFADLQLGIDALERIEIAQRDQRADLLAVFLDGLHTYSRRGAGIRRVASSVSAATSLSSSPSRCSTCAQWMPLGEYFGVAAPQKFAGGSTKKFFRRRADHHGASIAGEKQKPSSSPAITEFSFRAWY